MPAAWTAIAPAPADRQAGAEGHGDRREPDRRRTSASSPSRIVAHLLDQRHHRHPQLHPAHRVRPRELGDRLGAQLRRIGHRRGARCLDLQRRPVRRRRGAGGDRARRASPTSLSAPATASGCCSPSGCCGRGVALLTPSYAAYLIEWAGDRGRRPGGVERHPRAGRRGAGRRRAGVPRGARARLGRAGDRGDGHRRHRPVAVGRVRAPDRHAPGRARLHPPRADRPRDRGVRADGGRCVRRAGAHPPAPPGGAAAALPDARPRRGADVALPVRAHRAARALRRPHGRHADRARGQRVPLGDPRGGDRLRAADAAATSWSSRERAGVKQDPPLPVAVELAQGVDGDAALATAIGNRLRDVLVVQTGIELVPWGSLQRSEYKSRLVEHQPGGTP